MSTLTDALTLHLPLDDADGPDAADASGSGHAGTLLGAVRRVWDATFGACFDFAGGFVIAPDPVGDASAFTFALWVRPAPGTPAEGGIIAVAGIEAHGAGLSVNGEGLQYVLGGVQAELPGFFPTTGGWTHVAWACSTDGQRFFRDGVQVAEAPAGVMLTGESAFPVGVPDADLRVGHGPPWTGRIAHVRVWTRALDAAGVAEAIAADQVVPFRSSHPVDFQLEGPGGEQAIYINENPAAPGLTHTLTVRNTAGRPLHFLPLDVAAPDFRSHHLQLRFRRGVLSREALAGLALGAGTAGWQMSGAEQGDDYVSFYLLRTGTPDPLPDGASVALPLTPFSADSVGGARSARVELLTRNLAYDPAAGPDGEIRETRSQLLSVINHSGRQHVPLHVGFVGSATVLNDGQAHQGDDLRLRLTNTLVLDPDYPERSDLVFTGRTDGAGRPPSQLILSAVLEPDDEPNTVPWALARAGESAALNVVKPDGWELDVAADGSTRRWTLTPHARTVLGPGKSIDVVLQAVTTSLPAGPADLTVRWEDVPGYWDDQTAVTIQKTPLVLRPGAVGVGTAEPKAFHVRLPERGDEGAVGVLLSGGAGDNARLELRNSGNGTPYIDFAQGSKDYDARLRLSAPGQLIVEGARLGIGVDPGPTAQLEVGGHLVVRGSTYVLGFDFVLGIGDQVNRGNTGSSRALVKEGGAMLTLNYASDFTGGVRINGPKIEVNGTTTVNGAAAMNGTVRVQTAANHLQLYRANTEKTGGKVLFLELYQNDENAGPADNVFPIIRFHHNNRFWHRIEARGEGFYLRTGDLGSDNLVNLYVGGLQIGGTMIGERELQILKTLAAGQLEFDLYNVKQDEYAYAADYAPYDNDRRRIFTWRPKGRVDQGRWRLHYPS